MAIVPPRSLSDYADLISLPHPDSPVHPRMPMSGRAAQFSPFAALSGYHDLIEENARITDAKPELTEEEQILLNRKLFLLNRHQAEHPGITLRVFLPDPTKSGGTCVTVSGCFKRLDTVAGVIELTDGSAVALNQLLSVSCDLFMEDIE